MDTKNLFSELEQEPDVVRKVKETTGATEVRFDGSEYRPAVDDVRLSGQILRVFKTMQDGKWRTLAEIEGVTSDGQASISAQLRHLRKKRFGGHIVSKRHRGEADRGLFEYQLVVNRCPEN